jgi:hypothetical protein
MGSSAFRLAELGEHAADDGAAAGHHLDYGASACVAPQSFDT